MILSDRNLSEFYRDMITPFEESQIRDLNGQRILSFGLNGFGYDVRCSDEFQVFSSENATIIDPKNFDKKILVEHRGDHCIIPPNSFAFLSTVEYFKIPKNVKGIVLSKSSYARCGITVTTTPLQPGWEGNLVLEVSNHTPLPVKVYANEGIAEVTFFKSEFQCKTPYAGNYQKQTGIKTCDVS